MSSYNYRKNKGYESAPRSVSKKKSNNILISVVTVCVLLLAVVGAMGYFTAGFVTWDGTATAWAAFKDTITGWFSPAASDCLYEFEDFTEIEIDIEGGSLLYVLDIEECEWSDIEAGAGLVVEFKYFFEGEFVRKVLYNLIAEYEEECESFVFRSEEVDGLPGIFIIIDYVFDIEAGDFPYVSVSGSCSISVSFVEVEDYDSFNIINITYIPAE